MKSIGITLHLAQSTKICAELTSWANRARVSEKTKAKARKILNMWKNQLQIEKQNQSDSDSTQSSDSEVNPYTGKRNESQGEEGGYSPGGDNDGYQFGI